MRRPLLERARRRWRAGALLSRIARAAIGPSDPGVRLSRLASTAGLACDVFDPSDGADATVVALHGVTLNGKDDVRLQSFARALAVSGVRCVLPSLPGLSRLRWTPEDARGVASLLGEIRAQEGASAGLIGFSFGGSCALMAAARAGPSARFALSIGAYASLPTLYEELFAGRGELLLDEASREDFVYLALVMAFRNAEALGLDAPGRQTLEGLLRRACDPASLRDQVSFYEQHLAGPDPVAFEYFHRDPAALAAVSPAGQLGGATCPIALLHDRGDRLVPPGHARALGEELRGLPNGERHEVLVTGLLSHVGLGDLSKLGDLPALLDCFALLCDPS